jgi:hypothetical protein
VNSTVLRSEWKLDYIFLLLYPTTLFLACRLLVAGFLRNRAVWRRTGHVLSLAMLTAIPSDLIDNICGPAIFVWRAERAWLDRRRDLHSFGNFTIGGLCLLYLIVAGPAVSVVRRRTRSPHPPGHQEQAKLFRK